MSKLISPLAFICCVVFLLLPCGALRADDQQQAGSPPPAGVAPAFADGYHDGYSLGLEDRQQGVRPALHHSDRGYEGSLGKFVSDKKSYEEGLGLGYEDGVNSAPNRLVTYYPPTAPAPPSAAPPANAAQPSNPAPPSTEVLPPPPGQAGATPPQAPVPPSAVEGIPGAEFTPNSGPLPSMPLPPYATMPSYSAPVGLFGTTREASVAELDRAFDAGYRLGKPAGKKDARQELRFDPAGHAEYQNATTAANPASTPNAGSYAEHFRNGYLRGYADGFGDFIYRH